MDSFNSSDDDGGALYDTDRESLESEYHILPDTDADVATVVATDEIEILQPLLGGGEPERRQPSPLSSLNHHHHHHHHSQRRRTQRHHDPPPTKNLFPLE